MAVAAASFRTVTLSISEGLIAAIGSKLLFVVVLIPSVSELTCLLYTSMSTVYQDIGAIRNRGIEASINASVINNNNLTWNIYANMTSVSYTHLD